MCDAAGSEVTHDGRSSLPIGRRRTRVVREKPLQNLRGGDSRLKLDVDDERDTLGRHDLVDGGRDGGGGKAGDHGEQCCRWVPFKECMVERRRTTTAAWVGVIYLVTCPAPGVRAWCAWCAWCGRSGVTV